MDMADSVVSVIIPTYYRNDALFEAIKSVKEQSYSPIEIIVVDDSGEKHAKSVVSGEEVKYVPHARNKSANEARNTGISNSSGKYIQFLDDDDILLKDKIHDHVKYLESNGGKGVVYCGMQKAPETVMLPEKSHCGNVLKEALQVSLGACIPTTMMIRAEILKEIYPLSPRPAADDIGLKIKLAKRTKFGYIRKPLVEKRRLEHSRGDSYENANEIIKIIYEYEDYYKNFPKEIHSDPLARNLKRRGNYSLKETAWSREAIADFARSFYMKPQLETFAQLVLSLCGGKTYRLGLKTKKFLDRITES